MGWTSEAPGGAGKQDGIHCDFDYAGDMGDMGDNLLARVSEAISSESAMTAIALEAVIKMASNCPLISAALCQ
jgi:hypothetical protein